MAEIFRATSFEVSRALLTQVVVAFHEEARELPSWIAPKRRDLHQGSTVYVNQSHHSPG